jgi:hypothetical protein
VVLDNLAAHRVDGVRQALCGRDLPPYSPDLNPIEQLFEVDPGMRTGGLVGTGAVPSC